MAFVTNIRYDIHYSQKNHCNDFSNYNDIIAPLDKVIMLHYIRHCCLKHFQPPILRHNWLHGVTILRCISALEEYISNCCKRSLADDMFISTKQHPKLKASFSSIFIFWMLAIRDRLVDIFWFFSVFVLPLWLFSISRSTCSYPWRQDMIIVKNKFFEILSPR